MMAEYKTKHVGDTIMQNNKPYSEETRTTELPDAQRSQEVTVMSRARNKNGTCNSTTSQQVCSSISASSARSHVTTNITRVRLLLMIQICQATLCWVNISRRFEWLYCFLGSTVLECEDPRLLLNGSQQHSHDARAVPSQILAAEWRNAQWLIRRRLQLKCDGTRWRTGGEVKGEVANGVSSQYSSHYLGTWCIQHYYRWCAHLGCH